MELDQITISPSDYPQGARVFALNNTIEYNGPKEGFGTFFIIAETKEDLTPWGFRDNELDAAWTLDIGDKYDSENYGNSANIIRLA